MREFKRYLEKGLSEEDLEQIARYAITYQRFRLKQITDLLKDGIQERHESNDAAPSLFETHHHANVRGSTYYQ
ncbi:MAG: hypothetical protein IE880_03480 [Epsilonproteobacteria bacterium]|nr:hypothetical protein [Campylobacterota bacterium]